MSLGAKACFIMQQNARLINPPPCGLHESSGNWLHSFAWKWAPRELRELCAKTKQLETAPAPGFALQLHVSVADAFLLEWAAPSNSVAVSVLHQRTAGTPGTKVDFDRVRKRLEKVLKGLNKVVGYAQQQYSSESLAQRLASPFFLLPGSSYPELLTAAQQATADAARAKTDAARPGAILCYAAPRLSPLTPTPHLPFFFCAGTVQTPKGGSAAEDGRDASSALGLDEVDDDGMGEATRAAISAAAPEVPLDADSGSEEEGEEGDVDDDDDEDAAEDDGDWDVALRGLRLPVGTRVFVDEGTKGGVIGRA